MTSIISNSKHQKLLLGAAALGVVMDGLDGSIVNVALPTIASAFDTDTGTVAWVIITYLLMMAGLVLVFGSIADRGIMKRIFILGLAIFTLGSAVCGFSPALEILLASRVLQGIGAAMLAAVAPLLCIRYLPPQMLGASMGVLAASSSIGFAAGPALGGIITHVLSWHWIFLINIPVGIAAIILSHRVIPADTEDRREVPSDFFGAATFFGVMVFGIFALEEFPARGAADPLILVAGVLCVILFAIFIARELTAPRPFISLRLFRKWQFSSVLVAFLLINVVYTGVIYLLPFYLSAGMHYSLMVSGLFLLIPPVVTGLVSIPFGRWSDQYGRRWFSVASCVVLIVFNAIFAILVPESGYLPLIAGLAFMGLAIGIAGGPAASRIIDTAPTGEEGTGSSLMITTIYFGGVLGTAVYAALLTSTTAAGGVVAFADLDPAVFLDGFHFTIIAGLILAVVPLVLSAIVRDEKKAA
ncbi:MAG: MFS transporter [Methanoregula sp.]|jgi:EmrB/QacA subfamily drug resistance transporter